MMIFEQKTATRKLTHEQLIACKPGTKPKDAYYSQLHVCLTFPGQGTRLLSVRSLITRENCRSTNDTSILLQDDVVHAV